MCDVTTLNVLSFADDTTVSVSSSDIPELYKKLIMNCKSFMTGLDQINYVSISKSQMHTI